MGAFQTSVESLFLPTAWREETSLLSPPFAHTMCPYAFFVHNFRPSNGGIYGPTAGSML